MSTSRVLAASPMAGFYDDELFEPVPEGLEFELDEVATAALLPAAWQEKGILPPLPHRDNVGETLHPSHAPGGLCMLDVAAAAAVQPAVTAADVQPADDPELLPAQFLAPAAVGQLRPPPNQYALSLPHYKAIVDEETTLPDSQFITLTKDRSSLMRDRTRPKAAARAHESPALKGRRRRLEAIMSTAAAGQLLPFLPPGSGAAAEAVVRRKLHLTSLLQEGACKELEDIYIFVLRGGAPAVAAAETNKDKEQLGGTQQAIYIEAPYLAKTVALKAAGGSSGSRANAATGASSSGAVEEEGGAENGRPSRMSTSAVDDKGVGFTASTKALVGQLEAHLRRDHDTMMQRRKRPRLGDIAVACPEEEAAVTSVSFLTHLLPTEQRERRSPAAKAAAQQMQRRQAAQTFYDLLVLQNRGYVRLDQSAGAYEDLEITPRGPMLGPSI